MSSLRPRLPYRRAAPHAWSSLTDAEWACLEPLVAPRNPRTGRPTDRRRVWDAIFWVACSNRPWRELPAHLGKPDTAHRALRRAGQAGIFPILLLKISDDRDIGGWEALRWRICRAVRRIAKVIPLAVTLMANRLGLVDALPCAPQHLPWPGLSENIKRLAPLLRESALFPLVAAELRLLHRLAAGNPRAWRRTA
jgi:transposase